MTTPQDNTALRALFSLPPIQPSANTNLTVPETPAPKETTGDRELDAVLWLRDCIKTGHPALIEKALEQFKKISTPAKELEDRYARYAMRVSGNSFGAALASFGFADLEGLAKKTTETLARKHEALTRFGSVENLLADTPAEVACKKALRGLKRDKTSFMEYEPEQADERFAKVPALVPGSLSDCLYVNAYCRKLYWLRHATVDMAGDGHPALSAYEDYCFGKLIDIPPQSKDEAFQVLDFLKKEDRMGWGETQSILRNLVAGGWANKTQPVTEPETSEA